MEVKVGVRAAVRCDLRNQERSFRSRSVPRGGGSQWSYFSAGIVGSHNPSMSFGARPSRWVRMVNVLSVQ
jgi:hypothetical protein